MLFGRFIRLNGRRFEKTLTKSFPDLRNNRQSERLRIGLPRVFIMSMKIKEQQKGKGSLPKTYFKKI